MPRWAEVQGLRQLNGCSGDALDRKTDSTYRHNHKLNTMATTSPSDLGLKLSLQIDNKRISIESDNSDLTATELVELFYDLAIAATYIDNNIIDAMRLVADEHDRRGRNMT